MIKIGILCKQLDSLRNFELKIIEHILNDPDLELSLLIFDGRKKKTKHTIFNKIIKVFRSKNSVALILLKIQELFEKKIFKLNQTVDKETLINKTIISKYGITLAESFLVYKKL